MKTPIGYFKSLDNPSLWILIPGLIIYLIYEEGFNETWLFVSISYCCIIVMAVPVGWYIRYWWYGVATLQGMKRTIITDAVLVTIGIIIFILWVPANWQKGIGVLLGIVCGVLAVIEIGRRVWRKVSR